MINMEKLSNNKETINLLHLSENESDLSDIVLSPKKRKVKRRHRSNGTVKVKQSDSCCKNLQISTLMVWLVGIMIFLWLMTLSWLAVMLYGELKRIDITVKTVIAGSEGVPDALQKCHSQSKDLRGNQSIIFSQIVELRSKLDNISGEVTGLKHNLRTVQDWLHASPELANVPHDVKLLENSVGKLGSEILGLSTTVEKLKDDNSKLQNSDVSREQRIASIELNITNLSTNLTRQSQKLPVNQSLIESEKLWSAVNQLGKNLTHLNETLSRNLTWAIEDQIKDHKLLVSLQDKTENVSMSTISLQRECSTRRDHEVLQTLVNSLSEKVNADEKDFGELRSRFKELEQSYSTRKKPSDPLMSEVSLQSPLQGNPEKLFKEAVPKTLTTESHLRASDAADRAMR